MEWDDWERGQACRMRECVAPADCWLEDVPYCFEHAQLMIERFLAIDAVPSFAKTLPEIPHR